MSSMGKADGVGDVFLGEGFGRSSVNHDDWLALIQAPRLDVRRVHLIGQLALVEAHLLDAQGAFSYRVFDKTIMPNHGLDVCIY